MEQYHCYPTDVWWHWRVTQTWQWGGKSSGLAEESGRQERHPGGERAPKSDHSNRPNPWQFAHLQRCWRDGTLVSLWRSYSWKQRLQLLKLQEAWNLHSAWLTACWNENHRTQGASNISFIMSSIQCDIQWSKEMWAIVQRKTVNTVKEKVEVRLTAWVCVRSVRVRERVRITVKARVRGRVRIRIRVDMWLRWAWPWVWGLRWG